LAIHGGGFVSDSIATHLQMFGHLARIAGVATLAVEYGLVPGYVFSSPLDAVMAAYLAGTDARDPLAAPLCAAMRRYAPLCADLGGLPPTYLQSVAEESLLDDSQRLADRLREAGVAVRLDEFADQVHTCQLAAGRTAVADDAIEWAAWWLRSTLMARPDLSKPPPRCGASCWRTATGCSAPGTRPRMPFRKRMNGAGAAVPLHRFGVAPPQSGH
jgi:acetyl esterase/lipase